VVVPLVSAAAAFPSSATTAPPPALVAFVTAFSVQWLEFMVNMLEGIHGEPVREVLHGGNRQSSNSWEPPSEPEFMGATVRAGIHGGNRQSRNPWWQPSEKESTMHPLE
jgi:hypothetical protein